MSEEWTTIIVHPSDCLNLWNHSPLDVVKEKGGPVLGAFYLSLDVENYDWHISDVPHTGERVFKYRKRTTPA